MSPYNSQIPYPIVHINGFPGTGKLTIAKTLVKLLQNDFNMTARLIHNHLLIDLASAVLDGGDDGYQDFRKKTRHLIFRQLESNEATYQRVHIFTDFQSGDALGSSVCAEYKDLARRRGSILIPVVITCDEAENRQRLTSSERLRHGKLVDGGLVKRFRDNEAGVHVFRDNPAALELDVTLLTPDEAAKRIGDHIINNCPFVLGR